MGILSKLKLDNHHRIERFGVLFIALTLCMSILTGFILYEKTVSDKITLATQAIYTTSFQLSLTGGVGTVHGIYRSADSTKALVLLEFDDVSRVSTNADDYSLFLTGVSQGASGSIYRDELLTHPDAGIITFGSTGYMGVLLHDNKGFQNQIMDLIVRANIQLVSVDERAKASQVDRDPSFSEFDQFQIYFNAGADDCVISKALDGFEINDTMVFNIYNELVSLPAEKEARAVLEDDINKMAVQLIAIQDYENRLLRIKPRGIVPDAVPSYIVDDVVEYDDPADNTSTRRLITNQVISGGFDFNWQDGSVAEGYLDEVANGASYSDLMAVKRAESGMSYTASNVVWYQFDQSDTSIVSEYLRNSSSDSGSDSTIRANIDLLTSAWGTYAAIKQEYQTSHLTELLWLEEAVIDASRNYTINADEDVIKLY